MTITLALAAACLLGIGFVAQQHVAYREPLDEVLHIRLLVRLAHEPPLRGHGLSFPGKPQRTA